MTNSVESSRAREPFIPDPGLALYLPLYELDGASFMSKDAYGHLCTITGALWKPNGRYFDGVDDKIDCGNSEVLKFASEHFTLEAWIYPTSLANTPMLFDNSGYVSGYMCYIGAGGASGQVDFRTYQAGVKQTTSSAVGTIATNTWQHLVVTRSGATAKMFKNAQEVSYAATGTHIDPAAGSQNLTIGLLAGGNTNDFAGTIGEARIYNRALSVLEILHNYLATKWRYR